MKTLSTIVFCIVFCLVMASPVSALEINMEQASGVAAWLNNHNYHSKTVLIPCVERWTISANPVLIDRKCSQERWTREAACSDDPEIIEYLWHETTPLESAPSEPAPGGRF